MTTVSGVGVGDGSRRDPAPIGADPDLFSALQDGQKYLLKIPAGAAWTEAVGVAGRSVTFNLKQRWPESRLDADFIPGGVWLGHFFNDRAVMTTSHTDSGLLSHSDPE